MIVMFGQCKKFRILKCSRTWWKKL
jgi:hypothetical protein